MWPGKNLALLPEIPFASKLAENQWLASSIGSPNARRYSLLTPKEPNTPTEKGIRSSTYLWICFGANRSNISRVQFKLQSILRDYREWVNLNWIRESASRKFFNHAHHMLSFSKSDFRRLFFPDTPTILKLLATKTQHFVLTRPVTTIYWSTRHRKWR